MVTIQGTTHKHTLFTNLQLHYNSILGQQGQIPIFKNQREVNTTGNLLNDRKICFGRQTITCEINSLTDRYDLESYSKYHNHRIVEGIITKHIQSII